MNIKQDFAYAVPQVPALQWLVDTWPIAAGMGGERGGEKEGELERRSGAGGEGGIRQRAQKGREREGGWKEGKGEEKNRWEEI